MTPAQEQLVLEIIKRNPYLQVLKIGDHFQNRKELLNILKMIGCPTSKT